MHWDLALPKSGVAYDINAAFCCTLAAEELWQASGVGHGKGSPLVHSSAQKA